MISRRGLLSGAAALALYAALPSEAAIHGLDQPVFTSPARRLDQFVQRAGLWSNCRLALDVGDARSYTTGQTWADLSPDVRNFVRGANATPSTDDPTFNGTAGNLSRSEFWSFDGADFFTKSTANGNFENGHHKGGAARGFGFLVRPASVSSASELYSTKGSPNAEVGVRMGISSTSGLFFIVSNGSTTATFNATTNPVAAAWNFIGFVWTINGPAYFIVNDTVETFTATVTSPSAGDAADPARIGNTGAGGSNFPIVNNSRLRGVVGFDTAPSQASMLALSRLMRRSVS